MTADREEERPPLIARRLAAETFGTFALVFVAAGADTFARVSGGEVSVLARAVAPALMVAALIWAIGDVSGAHFNPAVTLAFAAKRLFPGARVVPYWVAQLVGAVVAAGLLRLLFGEASEAGVSAPHVPAATALILEVILTLLLVTVILGTADRSNVVGPDAAMAVGATIALCGLIALPIEGASMNPARSIGPALVAGDLGDLWVYIIGPYLGALAGALVTWVLHGQTEDKRTAQTAASGE